MAKKKTKLNSKKKAQANKKLIMVVVAVSVLTLAIVGGFWFINVYRGAERNISAGDVMMEDGEYKKARKMYGRAVKKEPGNMEHIAKLQDATLAIVPVTVDEAKILYNDYIGTLMHTARYAPQDAEAQFALLYELHKTARLNAEIGYWQQLQGAAETVLDRLPLDHPRRYEAKIFRGLTLLKIDNNSMTDAIDDDGDIRCPGEMDFLEALESDPGNALAWSALAQGRMAVYYRLIADGRIAQAEKNRGKAEQTMENAVDAAGGSLDVALVHAREVMLHRARLVDANNKKAGTHALEEVEVAEQAASKAIDAIVRSYDPATNQDQTQEVFQFLLSSGQLGRELVVNIFEQYLSIHKDDQTIRYFYASVLKELGRVDDSRREAQITLDAPQGTVSIRALQQFSIRVQAANLLFKLAFLEIAGASDEVERDKMRQVAKERRDVVLDFVSGDLFNPMILEADGDLAMEQGNHAEAAMKYEELISRYPYPMSKPEVYYKTAVTLFESGARGIARERVTDAINLQRNPMFYILLAEIELALSDYDAALSTLSLLPPKIIEDNPRLQRMLDNIALRKGDGTAVFNDPLLGTLSSAETLISEGKPEEAIVLLTSTMESIAEPDWRLFQAMALAHDGLGDQENALNWLDKAIALNPDPVRLKQIKIFLLADNRVEAIILLVQESDIPEMEKSVAIAERLLALSGAQRANANRWTRTGNEIAAKEATELSELAFAESLKYQKIAEESGADTVDFILTQFGTAMSNKNYELAKNLLERAEALGADPIVLGSSEIQVLFTQALDAGAVGENSGEELKQAEEIARKLTENFPFSGTSWRALGTIYELKGNVKEAFVAFEEAYRLAPDSPENVRAYVRILIRTNSDSQRILRVVHDARASFPNDSQLEEMWLGLEEQRGEKSKVLAHRTKKYQLYPEDSNNALQLGLFLVNTTPTRELCLNPDGTERFTTNDWARMNSRQKNMVLNDLKKTWNQTVETIIEKASATPPVDLQAAIAYASIERDRGRLDAASEVLDSYISTKIGTDEFTSSVIAVAQFLKSTGRLAQAVSLLESARAEQSEKMEISAALGALFLTSATRDYDRAVEELEVAAKATGNQLTYSSWVRALVLSNRFEEAEEALKGYKGTNIAYSKAMLTALIHRRKSEVLLAKGELNGAKTELELYRGYLKQAMKEDDSNQIPILELCTSLINEFTLTQNKDLLTESLEVLAVGSVLNESSEEYAMMRSRVLQAGGQLRRAIEDLGIFLAKKPESDVIRQKLIDLHLDADDFDKAVSFAQAGVEVNPSSAKWHRRLGDLYIRTLDDRLAAAHSYLDAINLDPSMSSVFVLDNITRTDQDLPFQDILKLARGPLSKQHPIVKTIEAKALHGLKQHRDALIAMESGWDGYQNAIEKGWVSASSIFPWFANLTVIFKDEPEEGESFALQLIGDDPTAEDLVGLANYWWEIDQNKIDHAITFLDRVIENPESQSDARIRAMMHKGAFLVEVKRYDEGEKVFRALHDENPDSPLILNNLSYVVGVYLNKPEEGLALAQRAVELAPNHPSVIDTISKLHELGGNATKAAETLEFLLLIDPVNADAMARLALLYAEDLGQPERGLVIAKRARSQKPRSPEALDALGWSYIQTGQVAKGERFLQRSIASGETSVAHIHIAQVVMEKGEYDEALGNLRIAEELSKDQHTLDRINALKDDIRKTKAAVAQ